MPTIVESAAFQTLTTECADLAATASHQISGLSPTTDHATRLECVVKFFQESFTSSFAARRLEAEHAAVNLWFDTMSIKELQCSL
jgi:hypothetical protein